MAPDRSWIFRRIGSNGDVAEEFKDGVDEFIKFAKAHPRCVNGIQILCPCAKCKNHKWMETFWVEKHLYGNGFDETYVNWIFHGERIWGSSCVRDEYDNPASGRSNPYFDMVVDAAIGSSNLESDDVVEEPNPATRKFYEMLENADEPLWDGCTKHTILSAVTQLLNLKSEYSLSETCFDRMIALIKSMLPDSEKLPENFYRTKRMVSDLGLGYEKIDVCRNFCVLYYKEFENYTQCPVCKEPRYKQRNKVVGTQKNVPIKTVRYLPIAPRLKRLYLSKQTAEYMRWHANGVRHDHSVMTHPSDAEAWKHFDRTHPSFAQEIRNVRLGLCTDGFNPFNNSTYSCWPVFVTPYNLPPSMCMKREFIFLTLLIPGPRSPGKSLDVCLRPLIDELKKLWDEGEMTFDSFRKQNFMMRAALMWTISDFPAYGMLSGWSTHGKLACPYCGDNAGSIVLKHGRKCSWFDCHRKFLPLEHPFRRDRNSFTASKTVRDGPPIRLNGEAVFASVSRLRDFRNGFLSGKQKQPGFGQTHNWVKKSIFWELPYWSSNLIRHNVDVMHVEKNVFENIFNTVMDIKGRTKDNVNAREDMRMICRRPGLELMRDGDKVRKPKATYVLDPSERKIVCEWIKDLKFPDGYASNIGRCVNIEDGRVFGMKSHDCHVFMQRLLPIAFRDILPKPIWAPLAELSLFFKELCSTKIRESSMEALEASIVETICKLEKIFPPAFFDVMEHLLVHLPYEAKVGGPVHCRWMYRYEREMLFLKRRVHNKARVEGSICEAYIVHEISNFVSLYFEPYVRTNRTQIPRNDDGGESLNDDRLSVFQHPCRPIGRSRKVNLSDDDLHILDTYVLVNSPELESYTLQFEEFVTNMNPMITKNEYLQRRDNEFHRWLREQVKLGVVTDQRVRDLSLGASSVVQSYNGIIVNGYRFHTRNYEQSRVTSNSGVCCRGSLYAEDEFDYYGVIDEILELSYLPNYKVFVFRCDWFDPTNGVKVDSRHKLVDVNMRSRLSTYEPFILAQQAEQVYYTKYPSKRGRGGGDWRAACKVRPRLFDPELINEGTIGESYDNEFYQEDGSLEIPQYPTTDVDDICLQDTSAEMAEIPINEIVIALDFQQIEEQIIDGEVDGENDDNLTADDNFNYTTDTDSD